MKIDYRQIYATILEDWLGLAHADTVAILGGAYEKLPLFRTASSVDPDRPVDGSAGVLALAQNTPNPARAATTIGFALPRSGRARLTLTAPDGRAVAVPVDGMFEAGRHDVRVDLSGLPSGAYVYTLESRGATVSKNMTIVR
jgi:hypothetical protein